MTEEKKKAKRPTAQKRMIQNEKRKQINRAFKSQIRGALRAFESAKTEDELKKVFSALDKGVKRGFLKANKAGRIKSRCTAKIG